MKNSKLFLVVFGAVAVCGLVVFIVVKRNSGGAGDSDRLAMITPTLPVPKLPKGASASSVGSSPAQTAIPANAQIVFVPRIVDGDTIMVETVDPATGEPGKPQSVRYIGMDTPETVKPNAPVECYGHEASARNKALVAGKYVAIVRDATDRDVYGRLLRYVYLLDGTFVDLELVAEGYARVLTIPPNTAHESEFKAAAAAAQTAKLGFWGACATYPFQ